MSLIYLLLFRVSLLANRDDYLNAPLNIEFEIPYFTISGLSVVYCKIEEDSRYDATPWVRYVTESTDYEVRL